MEGGVRERGRKRKEGEEKRGKWGMRGVEGGIMEGEKRGRRKDKGGFPVDLYRYANNNKIYNGDFKYLLYSLIYTYRQLSFPWFLSYPILSYPIFYPIPE